MESSPYSNSFIVKSVSENCLNDIQSRLSIIHGRFLTYDHRLDVMCLTMKGRYMTVVYVKKLRNLCKEKFSNNFQSHSSQKGVSVE